MSSILHVIETGGPGGAEGVFLELAANLRVPTLENIVAIGRDGWLADQARARGLRPVIVPAQGSVNIGYLRTLMRIIRETDVRVVIAHLFGAAVYASLAGILTRVPVISVLHGQSDVGAKERFAALKRAAVVHGSSRVVFVSSALQADLQPRLALPAARCVVIENGIDMNRYSSAHDQSLKASLGLPSSATLLGAVGNVRRAKGYETLLAAARIVCDRHPDVHLVIAGDTSGNVFPELDALLTRLELRSRVHFLGLRSDVPAVLSNLDLYVLSSHTEGFSLALVEAMASGRAVVATRSGGPETIINADETGVLVPPRDEKALAEAISRLLADTALRARLAVAAKSAITQRFSSQRMLDDYANLARQLVSGR